MPLILLQCSLCWLHFLKDSDEQTIVWPPSLLLSFVSLLSSQRACALKAIGLLLADSTATVGWGKTFWRFGRFFSSQKSRYLETKSQKINPKLWNRPSCRRLQTSHWQNPEFYSKNVFLGQNPNLWAQKKNSLAGQYFQYLYYYLFLYSIFLQIGKIFQKIGIFGHCRLNVCLFGPFWCYTRPKDNGDKVPRWSSDMWVPKLLLPLQKIG